MRKYWCVECEWYWSAGQLNSRRRCPFCGGHTKPLNLSPEAWKGIIEAQGAGED